MLLSSLPPKRATHTLPLSWESLTKWCTINLNVTNHVDQARTATASLKQTSTVAVYKAAFDSLVAQVGSDAGQQLF